MKNYILFSILFAVYSILLLTGFQCASQEMTSAKLYMNQSDWGNSIKWLTMEVEKNPTNMEAWWRLGFCQLQKENIQGALEAFNHVPADNAEFGANIKQAKQSLWGKSVNQGVALFKKSMDGPKDSSKSYLEQAVNAYKIALEVNKDSLLTYQNLSAAYLQLGKLDDGITILKQGLALKPTVQMYSTLINTYITKAQDAEAKVDKQAASDNYNNAIKTMQDARKLEPDNAELLSKMIDLYIRAGRANEAKPFMEEALAKDPSNKLYEYNLGVILMQNDEGLPEAITHFDKALKLDPKYEAGLQNIGIAYLRLGAKLKEKEDKNFAEKFKKAVGYFESLRDLKPEDANVYELLASAYINANMVKEGKAAYDKAQSLKKQ